MLARSKPTFSRKRLERRRTLQRQRHRARRVPNKGTEERLSRRRSTTTCNNVLDEAVEVREECLSRRRGVQRQRENAELLRQRHREREGWLYIVDCNQWGRSRSPIMLSIRLVLCVQLLCIRTSTSAYVRRRGRAALNNK